MQRLDGKSVALKVRQNIGHEVCELARSYKNKPGLAVVLIGEDPASHVYVSSKIKACEEVGFASFEHKLTEKTSFEEVRRLIQKLSQDSNVHGILVQLPLPKHLSEKEVIDLIPPEKDADCLTAKNLGLLFQYRQRVSPCTPSGVMEILRDYNIDVTGKNTVVVGRSQIVGLPMAQLLIQANATVTVAHSKTQNLESITQKADIVIAAIGKPRFFTQKYFKSEAVVIDVGIHRDGKKLCGDVDDIQSVKAITPVPGGVGPMTIAMLLKNTLELFKISQGVK